MNYEIRGTYRGKTEVVDTAETLNDARYLQKEYALAYGREWAVTIRHRNNPRRAPLDGEPGGGE